MLAVASEAHNPVLPESETIVANIPIVLVALCIIAALVVLRLSARRGGRSTDERGDT